MKTIQFLSSTRRVISIAAFSLLSTAAIYAQQPVQPQPAQQPYTYTISGNAAGTQVVPAVKGDGTGNITGTYDPATREFKYTTTWDKLSAAPNSAGFYNGTSGVAGKAIGDPWTLGANLTPTGTYTNSITLDEQQAKDLLAGNWYYSYGTTTNTAGEIRGQITARPGDNKQK